jgi:predicted lipid-binding transport protein (Tim44 family)
MKCRKKKQQMRMITLMIAVARLIGCADPAFQQYIQNRQAAIAAMPNGRAKYAAQERLDQEIFAEKRRQNQQAANAATAFALGAAAAAANAGASASQDACCLSVQQPEDQQAEIDHLRSRLNDTQSTLDDIQNRHPGL